MKIWIHGVSLGEILAAFPLVEELRKRFPLAEFLVTTVTKTAQERAKKLYGSFAKVTFLPLSPWKGYFWVRRHRPTYFFLLETDFWPHLLYWVKKYGGKNILVSGKMSPTSFRRFSRVSWGTKVLFRLFSHVFVQNREEQDRFAPFVATEKLYVGGNIKCDQEGERVAKAPLHFAKPHSLVVIASTHKGEEELLLEKLLPFPISFAIAPRHPDRFLEVQKLLERQGRPFFLYSHLVQNREISLPSSCLILIDQMGVLPSCFLQAHAAIVGGSFVPGIGGHNVLEPCLYQIPALFGPHMEGQKDLSHLVLSEGAGLLASIEEVPTKLSLLLENPSYRQAAVTLSRRGKKITTSLLEICLGEKEEHLVR